MSSINRVKLRALTNNLRAEGIIGSEDEVRDLVLPSHESVILYSDGRMVLPDELQQGE